MLFLRLLSILAVLAFAAGPASADLVPFNATLKVEIIGSTPLPPVSFTGMGTASVTGTGAPNITFGPGVLATATTLTVVDSVISFLAIVGTAFTTPTGMLPFPGTAPATNGPANFGPGQGLAGGYGGTMPISGLAMGRIFGCCWIPIPINVVGMGGTAMDTPDFPGFTVTVTGTKWTTGAVTLPTGDGMATTKRTGGMGPSGLTLVTPIRITATAIGFIPAFATLTLTPAPEPNVLLLLGSGLVGLTVIGTRRRRSRSDA